MPFALSCLFDFRHGQLQADHRRTTRPLPRIRRKVVRLAETIREGIQRSEGLPVFRQSLVFPGERRQTRSSRYRLSVLGGGRVERSGPLARRHANGRVKLIEIEERIFRSSSKIVLFFYSTDIALARRLRRT